MASLTSPGVAVSVIDESFYVPADAGTTPLFIVTSDQDKTAGSGTGTAPGTTSANANTVYLLTSQRDLTETFGDPKFYTDASGNPLQGYELNEYGLQAAYSFLGIANRAYVLRANVNLSELAGSSIAPTTAPTDGTYWFDLSTSEIGLNEWSATNQAFTKVTPKYITSLSDLVGSVSTGAPKVSYGSIGDYAINTTHVSNKIYYKNDGNAWVQIGSTAWKISHPTIAGTKTGAVTSGHSITINGTTVTTNSTTLENVASRINAASITGVTAAVDSVTGFVEIYSDGTSASDGSTVDGKIILANGSGTLLTDTGLTAGTYAAPALQQSGHASRPEWKSSDSTPRPNNSLWFKTTTPNKGTDISIKLYSSATSLFSTVNAPLYETNHSALYNLDPAGGGKNLTVGQLYTQYNITENSGLDALPNIGDFQVFRYEGGKTVAQSKTTNPVLVSGEKFTIQASATSSSALGTATVVTLSNPDGSSACDNEDFVAAVNGANIADVSASIVSSGQYAGAVQIEHANGGDIRMVNTLGTPLDDAGFSSSNANTYGSYTLNSTNKIDNLYTVPTGETLDSTANNALIVTNWKRLSYTASTVEPTNEPTDGKLWYDTNLEADILAHDGTSWKGYLNVYASTDPNGPQFSATEPTTQSDGTALVDDDLWVDTSDLENFPKLYRYNTSATVTNSVSGISYSTNQAAWILVDNTDQTTEDGILYSDARYHTASGKTDTSETGGVGTPGSIKDLLSDDFLDPDAPDPALYPKSMLLWNTRRSGYSVKEYKNNYITTAAYPGSGSTGLGNTRASNESVATYFPDRWVNRSTNNLDGSPNMGRKAQRKVIIEQLKAEINTNQAIREDQRGFNVMATPGYPEAIANMLNLNADRGYTSFVVGDTPMRLEGTATAITNWSNNNAGAVDNGDAGLVSSDEYLGVFYPSGRTSDNTGKSIIVPPSHMIMRVLASNDNVAFPWFAPAGTRRGVVDNATAVGYVNSTSGEFETISVTEGMRDAMHTAKVNPITFFAGSGIVNFGNLTKVPSSSTSALDRINVSRLTVYLRSQLNKIGKPFIFEPNDEITRNEIKQAVESFLLELVGQRALYDFLVVCDGTNNTPTRIDRNELYVDIAIEPVKSVEFIYIPLRLKNTGEISQLGS